MELRVGKPESLYGFSMEFWGESPDFYNVVIQSPTGERLSISSALKNSTQELSFVFVETKVLVNYIPIERRSWKFSDIFPISSSGGRNLEAGNRKPP